MRSEPNGNMTNRELPTAPDYPAPDSVLPSLVALNRWLVEWEERPAGGGERKA